MRPKTSLAPAGLILALVPILVAAKPTLGDRPKSNASRPEQVKQQLAPKLVTIKAEKMRLREALKHLTKQTGIEVEDRRRDSSDDPELKLDLKSVTFWQALDTIAKEADLRVALYQRGGAIALADGPHVRMPVCYDGLFRIAIKRITALYDLETDARAYLATLEVAWEPRLRPLFLESRPQGLTVVDDAKANLHLDDDTGGKLPVSGKIATTVDVRLPAPPRKAARLALLKGSMTLVGSTKVLEFEFDTLAKEKAAKEPKQTKDGVTVKLSRLDLAADHWTIEVSLEYPEQGPQFESFQSWVVNNECFLKKAVGEGIFPNKDGYSVDSLGSNRAVLSYHFLDGRLKKTVDGKVVNEKLIRGKPEDWKLVYRTPGPMAEVGVTFAFKDVPLP